MKAVLKKEIKENFLKFVMETIILCAISASLVPIGYKILIEQESNIPILAQKYGALLMKLKDFNFFIRSQWFGKNLLELAILFAVINGIGIIAGEYERKTSVFLFSKPVSRSRILTAKVVAAALYTVFPIIIATYFILPFSSGISQKLNFAAFNKLLLESIFASLFTLGIAVLFSVIVKDRIKGGLVIIGGIIAAVLLSGIKALHFLDYTYLFTGNFSVAVTISITGFAVFLFVSTYIFNRLDF